MLAQFERTAYTPLPSCLHSDGGADAMAAPRQLAPVYSQNILCRLRHRSERASARLRYIGGRRGAANGQTLPLCFSRTRAPINFKRSLAALIKTAATVPPPVTNDEA